MTPITIKSSDVSVKVLPDIGGRIDQIWYMANGLSTAMLIDRDSRRLGRIDPPDSAEPAAPDGTDLLRWGCYPMAPWPGRVSQGTFEFEGQTFTLPANLGQSAIHGTAFAEPWKVTGSADDRVTMEFALASPWPWNGIVKQEIQITETAIDLTLEVHAASGQRFPAGSGWHPWFSRRGMDPRINLAAELCYLTDDALIPTGETCKPAGDTELGGLQPLGVRRLDHIYSDVHWPVTVEWDDVQMELSASPSITHACVYTPPDGFCIEPMTCAADAFNLVAHGHGSTFAIVDDSHPLIAHWGIRFWPK